MIGISDEDMQKVRVTIASFHKLHTISDIILMGEDGACTRIILDDKE